MPAVDRTQEGEGLTARLERDSMMEIGAIVAGIHQKENFYGEVLRTETSGNASMFQIIMDVPADRMAELVINNPPEGDEKAFRLSKKPLPALARMDFESFFLERAQPVDLSNFKAVPLPGVTLGAFNTLGMDSNAIISLGSPLVTFDVALGLQHKGPSR